MKEKLAKLIDVKSIVTLSLTAVFCYLAITEKIPQEFMTVYALIIGFYFTAQAAKKVE